MYEKLKKGNLKLTLLSHTQFKATDRSYTKGDFVLKTTHVIELVTKLSSVVKETLKKELKVTISNTYVSFFVTKLIIRINSMEMRSFILHLLPTQDNSSFQGG